MTSVIELTESSEKGKDNEINEKEEFEKKLDDTSEDENEAKETEEGTCKDTAASTIEKASSNTDVTEKSNITLSKQKDPEASAKVCLN